MKTTNKRAKFETVTVSVLFFALSRERIFIETHSVQSRCVKGPENILFAGASVYLSAQKFYRLGSEGVKVGVDFASAKQLVYLATCSFYSCGKHSDKRIAQRAKCWNLKPKDCPARLVRPGPIYTGHACRHLPSAVPWISEDRLLPIPHLRLHTAPGLHLVSGEIQQGYIV